MAWALTTAHDRHMPPVEHRRNPWKPRAPTPEPVYLKLTTDSVNPVRIGSPIFPEIEKEEEAQRKKWQSRREAVQTPEEDPAEASKPLCKSTNSPHHTVISRDTSERLWLCV